MPYLELNRRQSTLHDYFSHGFLDFTIPSRILDDRLKILLEDVIALICRRIPKGYLDVIDNRQELGDIERILKTVYSSPAIPSGRFCYTIKERNDEYSYLWWRNFVMIMLLFLIVSYWRFQVTAEIFFFKFVFPRKMVSARLLLCGSSSKMGQTSYILPVIINHLDHLPVFSLSMANIFSYGYYFTIIISCGYISFFLTLRSYSVFLTMFKSCVIFF